MTAHEPTPSLYVRPAQAARRISLTERALTEMRRRGGGPPYIRLGGPLGRIRYDVRELDAWMRAQQHDSHAAETVAREMR